jgi:hypothetical protein
MVSILEIIKKGLVVASSDNNEKIELAIPAKHIDKVLVNYNPQGLRYSILVTYLECERDGFTSFIDKYKDHISGYAPESYSCTRKPDEVDFGGGFLRCMKMQYETGELYFTIYHIIVRMGQ